ncbi:MAG: folylpolyglutamate synthase/dihydrofolate synthase family protein [Cyclobacteriaceae bacterium]
MFQRIGAAALKKDLSNTIRLCEVLGNPQHRFKTVHVAGTNGKGSCSHMIASVLQHAGYKTGLYTSPHLKEFTERIRVDGAEVNRDFVVDFVDRIQPHIEEICPSFFEVTVVMAFDYFAKENVDVAVIEVGLGGRLDSTNVIDPLVSLITNIGFDHKDLLGDTLSAIASEKAGIIKPERPVVISELQEEVRHVFDDRATALNAPIYFASDVYEAKEVGTGIYHVHRNGELYIKELSLDLKGRYQKKNLPAVLMVTDLMRSKGFEISMDQMKRGIETAARTTYLKGRWQQLGTRPLVFCDVGHNAEGMAEVLDTLRQYTYQRLIIVLGMVKDKDVREVLRLMPPAATYFFCQAQIPRAMDANQLCQLAADVGLSGEVVVDVNEALRKAYSIAGPNDLIFVGGSTFVVSELANL